MNNFEMKSEAIAPHEKQPDEGKFYDWAKNMQSVRKHFFLFFAETQKKRRETKKTEKETKEREYPFWTKTETIRLITALSILFGSGSFIDAFTMGTPNAKDALYNNITREMSPEDIKQRIETLFQVEILSPPETPEARAIFKEGKEERMPIIAWNNEKLTALLRVLNELPPNFYYPVSRDKPLQFALIENFQEDVSYGKSAAGWCSCFNTDTAKQIVLSNKLNYQDFKKAATHELLHAATMQSVYEKGILNILEMENEEDLRKLTVAKEYEISDLSRDIPQGIIEKKSLFFGIIEGMTVGKRKTYLNELKNALKYASTNTVEFLAVAGEYYVGGRDEFIRAYSYIVGKPKAEKLYEFFKNNIFLGKEYYPNE